MNHRYLRRMLTIFSAVALLSASAAVSQAGLNINVNLGVPAAAPPPPPPPPPVYLPAPEPEVMLPATPPQFIYVPDLGYYVAVGTPYDIAYIGHDYFMFSNGFWYRTSYYGGPLRVVERRAFPPLLARHNFREIRRYREAEFRRYDRDREHYRGQMHRPEVRREEHKERREERKEERKEERREEKHDR